MIKLSILAEGAVMIKLFCDECGEEIDTENYDYFDVIVSCVQADRIGKREYPRVTQKDLCEYCGRVLLEQLKGEKK